MEKILLAVDGSEHGRRAATLAGELGRCMASYVDIVHVVSEGLAPARDSFGEYAELENVYLTHREILESMGRDAVTEAARLVRDAGGKVGKEEVVVGNPAHEIVSFAEQEGADCIVMGRRGLGDVRGLLMGSVSHKVGQLSEKTLITTE